MSEIDDLDRELARILDELLKLPADGYAERHQLLKQRDVLRSRASAFRLDPEDMSTEDLRAAGLAIRSTLRHVPAQDPLERAGRRESEVVGLARDRSLVATLTARLQRIDAQLSARGVDGQREAKPTTV